MLDVGAAVQLARSHTACVISRLIGEGAQGRVFAVTVDVPGGSPEYALKWYRDGFDTLAQRTTLEQLVERGIPSERFLWPIDLAAADGDPSFGYLMPLRPDTFVPISDVLNGRLDLSIATLSTVGMQLAESFLVLHAAGLCYRDINLGNAFVDPSNGDVLICDLDNVGIDGAGTAEIAGSPFFCAPEVIRGEAVPGIASDRFSLAVLLFLLLMLHHPLEGALVLDYESFDEQAERELFGSAPCFIFDPSDPSNRPVPGLHDNASTFWPIIPAFVRRLFIIAFTDGLLDPEARIPEGMWRRAMSRVRDHVVHCVSCETDGFYDPEARAANCWRCGLKIPVPPCLNVDGGESVLLTRGAVLTVHHLERSFDFAAVADVSVSPSDHNVLGLRNLTSTPWRVGLGAQSPTTIGPGRSVGIVDGLVIELGPGRIAHVVASPPAPLTDSE